ncbi:diguanylate cyclase [Cryptosporangium japonicum]|uniref:Non-specific serine/threonine protein kinase n=1 Tax=Cryptosporangium japonicum TaxID=80872 RepID=A0ABN0US14_9ACTN
MSLDRHDDAGVLLGLDRLRAIAATPDEADAPTLTVPSGPLPAPRPSIEVPTGGVPTVDVREPDVRAAAAAKATQASAGYEILGELGRGSRTVAYRVRRGDGVYAMKIARERPPASDGTGGDQDDAGERAFRREAALLACIAHPGLARVHEVGTADGRPYLVMDLVEGDRLPQVLADGPLDVGTLLAIGIDVADALAAAHRAGLVHRDIKPENILVSGGVGHVAPQARLIDFGMASRLGAPPDGTVAGTMLYCAPEQSGMLHRPVDGRADLYALGAVLFECATGAPPFASDDVGALLRMHATVPPPDPLVTRRDLPSALGAVILRLLAKDPDDRYQSGAGLVADLRRIASGADRFTLGADDHPVAVKSESPLVGRDAELGALAARWQRVRDAATGAGPPAGGAVLVTGPPGSGKSRITAELTGAVTANRGLVLSGKCDPDASLPLAPLRAALDDYVATVRALPPARRVAAAVDLTAAAGPAAPLLHGLSPALGALVDAAPPLADERDQPLSGAVAGFLAALARSAGGLVLHLDDLHWMDDATGRVLRQLADELPDAPVLVLGTCRDDPGHAAELATARNALGPALDLTVRLEPLAPAAIAELVFGMTSGIRIDSPTAAALAARSDGNPFTLLQFLTAIVDAGLARPSWGTWQIDPDLLHDVELPLDAVELVLDRLRGLDEESRQLLGIAAALGPHFDPGLVAEVGRIARRRAIEVASAAAWRHLLERRDGDNFQFLHDRIREALLAQFDPATLRGVHARIADVLAGQAASSPSGSVPATVYARARHRQLADDGSPDVDLFEACAVAGRLALTEHAPAEAVGFLEAAASAAARAGLIPDAGFLLTLGRAQHRTGHFREALGTLEIAHRRAADPMERARVLALVAQVHDSTWATDRQVSAVDEALAVLGHPLPENPFVLVASTVGTALLGCLMSVVRIGYGGVRGTRRELYGLLTELYDIGALAYARQLRPTVALAFTLRGVFLTARIGRGQESARMSAAAAHLAFVAGLRPVGRWLTRRAHRTAAWVGDPQLIAFVDWLEALDRHFFGLDQGERVREVLAGRARWLDAGRRIDLLSVLCWDTLLRGDVTGAEDVFARRQALVEASDGAGALSTTVHACHVGLLALQGRPAEAAAQLERVRAGGTGTRWERVDVSYAAMLAEVEQGDCGPAFDRAAEDLAATGVPWWNLIPIQRGLFVYQAYGRVEQLRMAPDDERLARARAAVRTLRLVANTALLRAHYRVVRAALRLAEGRADGALRALNAAEPALRAVDAPLVAFEAARLRARALLAQGVEGESARQARYALTLAVGQRWPHRARQVAAEFDLEDVGRLSLTQARSSDGVAVSLYRQRLDAIQQVGLAASRVLHPSRVAAVALDETIRILGAERAFLFLVDDAGQLRPHGGRDAAGADLGTLTGYSATLVERVWQTRTALVVTGTEEGAALGAESVVLHGLRSIMVAPILLEPRLLGVVYLDSRVAKGIFTADDVGVLTAITSHVAVALETARAAQLEVAVSAAHRQRDLAETLRDALAAITGILEPTPEQVLRRLLTVVFGVVGGDSGWLVQPAPAPPLIWVRAATRTGRHHRTDDLAAVFAAVADADEPGADDSGLGVPTGSHPVAMDADGRLARLLAADQPVISRVDAPRLVTDALPDARCWLALPLIARGEHLGVLLFATAEENDYDDGVAEIAGALVGQGMVAYENARLFAEVRRLATIDGLTGVANRRHFFELAVQDVAVSRRDGAASWPVAAMMIDIDHFKRVNDEHGHQVGDEVIQVVAARLRQNGRGLGLLGRYGGEEFVLTLRAGPLEAARVAEELRAAVADEPVPTSAGPVPVTISLGITYLRDGDLEGDPSADALVSALLGRADRCLYLAKHAGRNRVHVG